MNFTAQIANEGPDILFLSQEEETEDFKSRNSFPNKLAQTHQNLKNLKNSELMSENVSAIMGVPTHDFNRKPKAVEKRTAQIFDSTMSKEPIVVLPTRTFRAKTNALS